jgi:hypothetical protein
MTSPHIDVVIGDIRKHADRVGEVAARVYEARSAANQVSMDKDAYGVLCSPLITSIISLLEVGGIAAITSSAEAVESTADALRDTASAMDTTDDDAAKTLWRAAGE